MVPEDSSAARMPRPSATIAAATLLSSARFMGASMIGKRFGLSYPQHLDPGQCLALHPFKKRAASGRHIGEAFCRARGVERRNRVAAPRHRDNLAGLRELGGRFRDLDRAVVERL